MMLKSLFSEFILAFQSLLRWQFIKPADDQAELPVPGRLAMVIANGFFGLVLACAGTIVIHLVRVPWLAPAIAAICTALLRGYLTAWRQAPLPLKAAELICANLGESQNPGLRLQVTATWLTAARPFIYFCFFVCGCQFWLMPALALGYLSADDLRESFKNHQTGQDAWIAAIFLAAIAALFNRINLPTSLGIAFLAVIIAWLLPSRLQKLQVFRLSHKLNGFLLEAMLLVVFLLSIIF